MRNVINNADVLDEAVVAGDVDVPARKQPVAQATGDERLRDRFGADSGRYGPQRTLAYWISAMPGTQRRGGSFGDPPGCGWPEVNRRPIRLKASAPATPEADRFRHPGTAPR